MPRSNRYILPGYAYHVTHRCHNRSFLFSFVKDRKEYRDRLRIALTEFNVSLMTYCITSNHTHLLIRADVPETISKLMQKLEGEFADFYNIRKKRSGAFWGGRFHCTMIDSEDYLWNCMKYIDLNMVRAGMVPHPSDWDWCGYRELMGIRKRYCLINMDMVLAQYQETSIDDFRSNYAFAIQDAINRQELQRDPAWTESIAVGTKSFVDEIQQATNNRTDFTIKEVSANKWTIKETTTPYG